MGHRAYSRRGTGQFRRATLANTFGLDAPACPNPECRRLNPYKLGTPEPTHCHACGGPMHPEQPPADEKTGA
jgi:hypothetical protein